MQIAKQPTRPRNYKDTKQLLKYVIKMILYHDMQDGHYTHNQFANKIFGKADEVNMVYLNKVFEHYKRYVEYSADKKSQFRFDVEKILKDHPDIIRDNTKSNNLALARGKIKELSSQQKVDEMIIAVEDEIVAAKEDLPNNIFYIKSHRQLKYGGMKGVFDLKLDIENDQLVKVYEGMPALLKVGDTEYELDILSYDQVKGVLTIDCLYDGVDEILTDNSCQVIIDPIWLLETLIDRLGEIRLVKGQPINRLLNGNYSPRVVTTDTSLVLAPSLYKNQNAAIKAAHKNDLSIIWGPPGTGKTFTLSHYLANSLMRQERTLVCCIANVAVDNVTRALIETLENEKQFNLRFKNGQVLRVGNTRDPELVDLDYLFPRSHQIDDLRKRIRQKNKELSNAKFGDEKNVLKSLRNRLKKDLANRVRNRVSNAKVIFSTAAKFHVDPSVNSIDYDNLVIDEASMMSVPHFMPMAAKANKRIIITGDFRQLGPVVLSRSKLADKWLFNDLFKFAGLNYNRSLSHPGLTQLDVQRRFHPQICSLINSPFYKGKLKTDPHPKQRLLKPHNPNSGNVISYHDLSKEPGFVCKSSSRGSRYNIASAEYIVNDLLTSLTTHPKVSEMNDGIGVITPYRAQVNQIHKLIAQKKWSKAFTDKINVGTIHAFQGSQADLLILDLVESKERQLGVLYRHGIGARLTNVAVSRARSKLIVVGDINAILKGRGNINMTFEVRKLFQRLKKYMIVGSKTVVY